MKLTEMFGEENSPLNTIRTEVKALAKGIGAAATLEVTTKEADGDVYMSVSLIRLPKEDRKQGYGTAIMNALCDYADKKGIIVALSPTSEFGTGKATLVLFYKSFGFVSNMGKSKNFLITDTMIRYPKV
jgi:GNAT superfamily N-acetyltransferase